MVSLLLGGAHRTIDTWVKCAVDVETIVARRKLGEGNPNTSKIGYKLANTCVSRSFTIQVEATVVVVDVGVVQVAANVDVVKELRVALVRAKPA